MLGIVIIIKGLFGIVKHCPLKVLPPGNSFHTLIFPTGDFMCVLPGLFLNM